MRDLNSIAPIDEKLTGTLVTSSFPFHFKYFSTDFERIKKF